MIREIQIEGFKSIDRLKLKPGRVTVLIGENGCGKSNILEAIAMAGAAAADKLDHEFLFSRGIRVTDPRFMVPAFSERTSERSHVSMTPEGQRSFGWRLEPPDDPTTSARLTRASLEAGFKDLLAAYANDVPLADAVRTVLAGLDPGPGVMEFLIYAPENTALRQFHAEGQILPLGIRGDGLFAHLRHLQKSDPDIICAISERLRLIDWFDGFEVPSDLSPGEHRIDIRDRYIDPLSQFDQRSANEGFLFLLFYYTLLISPKTPRFFAIDNIDASLNPRLCARLMRDITELAKAHDKQVIVTTHNPAILDGLDLGDPEQKLMVVSRSPDGPTGIRRVRAPEAIEGAQPVRLSEAFIWGYLGGLPTNF